MMNWLFGKTLQKELYATKDVRVCGVKFTIKKVNLLNYLDGSRVLLQRHDIHKTARAKAQEPDVNGDKAKSHQCEVLVAGLVEPALRFSNDDDASKILVDDLFINQEMVNGLYTAILEFTYGKKKVRTLLRLNT